MISTEMLTCLNISDPLKPIPFRSRMTFDPAHPLEVWFELDLDAKDGPSRWVVSRQLVFDGLEATLLTGLGDFKCRSNASRFVVQLAAPECYIATISLPRDLVHAVISAAEQTCPLRDCGAEPTDEDLAAWLGVL